MSESEQLLVALKTQTSAINRLVTVICQLAESTHELAMAVAGDDEEGEEGEYYMDGTRVKAHDN